MTPPQVLGLGFPTGVPATLQCCSSTMKMVVLFLLVVAESGCSVRLTSELQDPGALPYTSVDDNTRSVVEFYGMIRCGANCNPFKYNGYGCYCGIGGGGVAVDGIDRCCQSHDRCYSSFEISACKKKSTYYTLYKWECRGGRTPYCSSSNTGCRRQLCECDRKFVQCVKRYPCPSTKAKCR